MTVYTIPLGPAPDPTPRADLDKIRYLVECAYKLNTPDAPEAALVAVLEQLQAETAGEVAIVLQGTPEKPTSAESVLEGAVKVGEYL